MVSNHYSEMALPNSTPLMNCSDCVVCENIVQQIQCEAVADYKNKTAIPNETLAKIEARRRAFLYAKSAATFLLMPGGKRMRWQLVFHLIISPLSLCRENLLGLSGTITSVLSYSFFRPNWIFIFNLILHVGNCSS